MRFMVMITLQFLWIGLSGADYDRKIEANIVKFDSVAALERFTILCDPGGWVSLEIPENDSEISVRFLEKTWRCERNGTGSWNLTALKKGENILEISWQKRIFHIRTDSRNWGYNCSTVVLTEALLHDNAKSWGERLADINLKDKPSSVETADELTSFSGTTAGLNEYLLSLQGRASSEGYSMCGEAAVCRFIKNGLILQAALMFDRGESITESGLSLGTGYEPAGIGAFIFADFLMSRKGGLKRTLAAQVRPGLRLSTGFIRGTLFAGLPLLKEQYAGTLHHESDGEIKVYNRAILHGGFDLDIKAFKNLEIGTACRFNESGVKSFTLSAGLNLNGGLGALVKFSANRYRYNHTYRSVQDRTVYSLSVGMNYSGFSGFNQTDIKKSRFFPRAYPVVVSDFRKQSTEPENRPELNLTVSRNSGSAPLKVVFRAEVSGGAAPYEISWNFSDKPEKQYPGADYVERTFSISGEYYVRAKVKDRRGRIAESSIEKIYVSEAGAGTFILSATSSEGGVIEPEGDIEVSEGSSYIFRIVADKGYRVYDVYIDGTSVGELNSYEFRNILKDHRIHARFQKDSAVKEQFTIKATSNSYGNILPSGDIKVDKGGNQIFRFKANSGCRIGNVLVDGYSVNCENSYEFRNVQKNHGIKVEFEKNPQPDCTITAEAGANGKISPEGDVSVSRGSDQLFTITPDKGYTTDKLTVDGKAVENRTEYWFRNVTENHTIKAEFRKTGYTVTAGSGAGGRIEPSGEISVKAGDSIEFKAYADDGYKAGPLIIDGVSQQKDSHRFENIGSDHTIMAQFERKTWTVSVDYGPGGKVIPRTNVVNEGDAMSLRMEAYYGYEIEDVIVDGVSKGAIEHWTFNSIRSDHSLYASFRTARYTIVAEVEGGGSISPAGEVVVEHGSSRKFIFTPLTQTLHDVIVDGVSLGAQSSYTFTNITGNHRIKVVFR